MAANINARLQRTQRGRDEIRDKSHALTQSERLILALVDGITPTEGLKRKLPGMVERRFRLVVADLIAKGFVEQGGPTANPQPEILDAAILEHYVRQDPLDPVTITALTLQPGRIGVPRVAAVSENVVPVARDMEGTDTSESSGVDFYLPLEAQVPIAPNLITANGADQRQRTSARRMKRARRSRNIQIGYWLLFAGLVCAVLVIALMRTR